MQKVLRLSLNVKGARITGFILGLTNFSAEKSGLYKRWHRDILSNIKFTTAAA